MYTPRLLVPLLVVLLAPGCAIFGPSAGASANEAPMRSPTLDYPPPPVQTADGQILGADGMSTEDKLRTSPRVGSGGVTPADVPAFVEKASPEPRSPDEVDDPICNVLAMNVRTWIRRCPNR
jgi:hypothetical protein